MFVKNCISDINLTKYKIPHMWTVSKPDPHKYRKRHWSYYQTIFYVCLPCKPWMGSLMAFKKRSLRNTYGWISPPEMNTFLKFNAIPGLSRKGQDAYLMYYNSRNFPPE